MKKTAIYILTGIIFLVSCGPVDEWTEASVKDVSSNLYFDFESSRQFLSVYSSSSFTLSSNESWCSTGSQSVDGFYVWVGPNLTVSKRTATITIKYKDEIMKTVAVEQQGNPYVIGNMLVQKEDIGTATSITWYGADRSCFRLVAFELIDWRLPTESELNILYENRHFIGNFKQGSYWSSDNELSHNDNVWALHWMLDFGSGYWTSGNSEDYYPNTYARCVRTI